MYFEPLGVTAHAEGTNDWAKVTIVGDGIFLTIFQFLQSVSTTSFAKRTTLLIITEKSL